MKRPFGIVSCAALLVFAAAQALAQQDKAAPKPQPVPAPAPAPAPASTSAEAKVAPPVEYKPPSRGAPRVRVGGSTRSAARELSLAVVAPDHTGLAATDQPELFWYVSQPVKSPLEFTLIAQDAVDPLVEKAIAPVAVAGIQRIRLADLDARLKRGEEYQWSISFVADSASRSKDTVASGRVRYEPLPAGASPGAGPGAYAAYASAGYWYDALAALRREIDERPGEPGLRAAQQSLLEQVGLTEIARHEGAGESRK